MEKTRINRFISKYNLAGLVESVKWESKEGSLSDCVNVRLSSKIRVQVTAVGRMLYHRSECSGANPRRSHRRVRYAQASFGRRVLCGDSTAVLLL